MAEYDLLLEILNIAKGLLVLEFSQTICIILLAFVVIASHTIGKKNERTRQN